MNKKIDIHCEFCHVAIHKHEQPALVGGNFFHQYHTPEKTAKLKEVEPADLHAKVKTK